ncbi:hypothetical protein GQ457_HM000470 [Hibiscus cannabinus]
MPPVYTIWIGIHPGLVVSSWEIAKEIFTHHDVAVTNRPGTIAAEHLGSNYAMAGVAPYGSYWREMRKVINIALLSNRRIEILKHVRASEAQVSVKELYKTWLKGKNDSGHASVEMKQWFRGLDVECNIEDGSRQEIFRRRGAKGEEARRCQMQSGNGFHLLGCLCVERCNSLSGVFGFGWARKGHERDCQGMDNMASEWLQEHKRKRESNEVTEQDFMDVLLSLLEGTNPAPEFDVDTITKSNCLNMITGGGDTTMVALTWTLSFLLNNRQWLRKAQEALDIHVGRERLVNESDLSKLECLQAIVKETLRLHPPVLLYPRLCHEDITVSSYHVPRGSWIFMNIWKIHRR